MTAGGTYTLTDKEGVEKNITYTNISGDTYWPRVQRIVQNATHTGAITVTIRNNGTETVKVAVHAGVIDNVRSDGYNNAFFPLWQNRGKSGNYFDDGETKDIAAGASQTFTITVDAPTNENHITDTDTVSLIQFLFDNIWGDSTKRSGDIDIVSVIVA